MKMRIWTGWNPPAGAHSNTMNTNLPLCLKDKLCYLCFPPVTVRHTWIRNLACLERSRERERAKNRTKRNGVKILVVTSRIMTKDILMMIKFKWIMSFGKSHHKYNHKEHKQDKEHTNNRGYPGNVIITWDKGRGGETKWEHVLGEWSTLTPDEEGCRERPLLQRISYSCFNCCSSWR